MADPVKIPLGALEHIIGAFDDILANPLALKMHVRFHNQRAVIVAKLKEFRELKDGLIKPYDVRGKGEVKDTDPGFAELVEKVNELHRTEWAAEIGEPVDLSAMNGQADKIVLNQKDTYAVLKELGAVTGELA